MKAKKITVFVQDNPTIIKSLGKVLYDKISMQTKITEQDCIDYIYNLTIHRTYDGYIREKSVINDGLAKHFPTIRFEESPPELDHSGDVDYIGWVTEDKAFGIQIKPTTAQSNFGNYSPSERMKASFQDFEDEYGGKVFIIFSLDGTMSNKEMIQFIENEINRLTI